MNWRPYLVMGLLTFMFLAGALHLTLRTASPAGTVPPLVETGETRGVPQGPPTISDLPSDAGVLAVDGSPSTPDAGLEEPSEEEPSQERGVHLATDSASRNSSLLDRSLRVIGTGWDVLAPGLKANNGLLSGRGSLFVERGVTVNLAVAEEVVEIERALARGGEHPEGADVAVMPLPTLVAVLDDLAPLEPVVFLVTGWSRGQHALYTRGGEDLSSLPTTGDVRLACREGTPEHFLAIFVSRFAGVQPVRIEAVPLASEAAADAALIALETPPRLGMRREGDALPRDAAVVLSTSHAAHLIPYVAIAPRDVLRENRSALIAFGSTWLEAGAEVEDDVPGTARQLALIEGAPDALDLMGPISRMAASDLDENARFAGLAGAGPLTLRVLADEVLHAWLAAGLLPGAPATRVEVDTSFVSLLVRTGLSNRSPNTPGEAGELAADDVDEDLLRSVLNVRSSSLGSDVDGQVLGLGLIAEVFAPFPLRIPRGSELARLETIADAVRDRYDVPAARFLRSVPSGTPEVEVMVPR